MKPVNLSAFTCTKPRFGSPQVASNQRVPQLAATASGLPSSAKQTATAPQCVLRDVDLFVLIAENMTDTISLLHLVEACDTARQALKQMPRSMIVALLNTLPLEMRQMAVGILALESTKLCNTAEREEFINTYLGHSDEPLPQLSNSINAFMELRDIASAVETFTPLYVNACLKNLESVEAAKLANPRPFWKYDGDEERNFSRYGMHPLAIERARRDYLLHLSGTSYPLHSPTRPTERYRIQRAFWRFEIFCRLFPETPTIYRANDVELNKDRRRYLSRLQQWECEEVASVVPFLFRVLERIYNPAILRNQARHVKRSELQWKSFLAPAPMEKPEGFEEEPSDFDKGCDWYEWQRECGWMMGSGFAVYGPMNIHWRLGKIGLEGKNLSWGAAEISHQKWLAHQVSKGLKRLLTSHQQYVHDEGEVFSRRYPIQRYEPPQLHNAPIETLLKWRYWTIGHWGMDDERFECTVTKHVRQWEDMSDAYLPSCSWISPAGRSHRIHSLSLREFGYVFWDTRNKKEDLIRSRLSRSSLEN